MDQLKELDGRIFREYIGHKAEAVVGIVEPGTKMGYFDWENCTTPQGVRHYVKEILLNLVIIHAEVRRRGGEREGKEGREGGREGRGGRGG